MVQVKKIKNCARQNSKSAREQGAKSELKNLALVDVHQFRLTNFYFAWKLFRFQVPKTQPVIQKLDYCFQIDYIIIVHQCNETKSEIISTLCLCDGHPLLVGTPDNSSRVFNCFAPDKFLPFLRQCYVLRRFAPDNLYGFAGASRLIFFLRFFRRFAPDNFLRILLSVRCFAPDEALRAWGPNGQVWTHFSHLDYRAFFTIFGW